MVTQPPAPRATRKDSLVATVEQLLDAAQVPLPSATVRALASVLRGEEVPPERLGRLAAGERDRYLRTSGPPRLCAAVDARGVALVPRVWARGTWRTARRIRTDDVATDWLTGAAAFVCAVALQTRPAGIPARERLSLLVADLAASVLPVGIVHAPTTLDEWRALHSNLLERLPGPGVAQPTTAQLEAEQRFQASHAVTGYATYFGLEQPLDDISVPAGSISAPVGEGARPLEDAIHELAFRDDDFVRDVMAYIQEWGQLHDQIGRAPSTAEYAERWGVSAAVARDRAESFADLFDVQTPAGIWRVLHEQVPTPAAMRPHRIAVANLDRHGRWGLTDALRATKPFGLDERWLEPGTVIWDPLHGDIHLNRLETALLSTPTFQRLHGVRALGTAYMVYPGATHTRFSHALGSLRVAQDLLTEVSDQRVGHRNQPDLFGEWELQSAAIHNENLAESTVLVRLAALLHDVGRLPFADVLEGELGLPTDHLAVDRLLREVGGGEEGPRVNHRLVDELQRIWRPDGFSGSERETHKYRFVRDLVSGPLGALAIDGLKRDLMFAGLPFSFGGRLLSALLVTPSTALHYGGRVAIKLTSGNSLRADLLSETVKFLGYRYELGERVLEHRAKVAADAMLAKAVGVALGTQNERQAADRIRWFANASDEMLLGWLAHTEAEGARTLAADLHRRRLFKLAGRARAGPGIAAAAVHRRFGHPDRLRALEADAARSAGLAEPAGVVIRLPAPRRAEIDVLVQHGNDVSRLVDTDHGEVAKAIARANTNLWSIGVFLDPKIANSDRDAVLAYLAMRLGVNWGEQTMQLRAGREEWPAGWEIKDVGSTTVHADELLEN